MNRLKLAITILFLVFLPLTIQAQNCDTNNTTKICLSVQVNAPNNKPLSDIIVYIEPLEGQKTHQTQHKVIIAQNHKTFSPYLSVSQTNQTVIFTNQDDITHHIYSVGNNKFSFKIKADKEIIKSDFNQPAEVAMGCNIHDWMSGYLLVLDTPYFDKTNQQGFVNIPLAEKGKYRVVIWHPQLPNKNNRITIEKNITTNDSLIFTLQKSIAGIPKQENEDDFDFLSDY